MADVTSKQKIKKAPTPNTGYRMKPSLDDAFKGIRIKQIIRNILAEKLHGKVYNVDEVRIWTRDIADSVNVRIKDRVPMPSYKYVVQVMLGQQQGAGCQYYAKCCWDIDTDSQASETFNNPSIFCVCTVFGVYLY